MGVDLSRYLRKARSSDVERHLFVCQFSQAIDRCDAYLRPSFLMAIIATVLYFFAIGPLGLPAAMGLEAVDHPAPLPGPQEHPAYGRYSELSSIASRISGMTDLVKYQKNRI